ncbi:hypothetical protein [Candidatus Sulfurimonas baltica]|uniref:Uncharacterized protein n=1 Tax=Candidatus Sulfurimonas baltica TaxID=2740404 RepID=A0A7S7LW61_9BACT|nr:hypothetical protein [Candidatus Sulfurimonas baltica]QOY52476.1 hypothetical protein HUE88_01910 [Candidatus Sulfurimonas baltica]
MKSYKKDFTKSIGAAMHLSRYQRLQVPNLKAFDEYLKQMSSFDTITLGLATEVSGLSKTAKAYSEIENPDFIFRGKNHIKYFNDLYPYTEGAYSLYFFDIDYDESQPQHFRMSTVEEVRASLILLVPALKDCAMLIRPSSSAGIYNSQTGEKRSDKPSWHIYLIVANATAQSIDDFSEYIKRRANRDDVNLAYIKESKSGAKLERYYVDLAVADASRLIVEASPTLEYPLSKKVIDSTIIEGEVLDLTAIPIGDEKDYRKSTQKYISGTIHTHSTKNTFIPKSYNGVILISEEDKGRVLSIYSYLNDTSRAETSVVKKYLSQTLIAAYLTFLGFTVDANFKFKMRDETTSSASISHTNLIKDFGGTFSGNIISFLMKLYSLSFIEAWSYFQNCFGKNLKLSVKTQVALPDAKAFEKSLSKNIK